MANCLQDNTSTSPTADRNPVIARPHQHTMNALHFAALLTLLAVPLANAGSEHLVKQRAKDVRDHQNERQGAAPASPSAPPVRSTHPTQPAPVPYSTQPAAPTMSPQAASIGIHLGTIQKADTVTDEQTRELAQSLSVAARSSVKPSASKISRLAGDLSEAVAGTDLSSTKRSRLAAQLESALNDTFSAKDMEALATSIHDTLRDAGAGKIDATVVSNDIKSIIAEVQKGKAQ